MLPEARQAGVKALLDSQIGGENATVAQLRAQLGDAEWELARTSIRAPADRYVTLSALAVGDRVTPMRSMMSFLIADDIVLLGVFQQNGLKTVIPGAKVRLVLANDPGRIHDAKVLRVGRGVGQGQLSATGTLARIGAVGLTAEFPVEIELPRDLDRNLLRPGMSGAATAFSPDAGPIGVIASILLWVSAYMAYL
ncbi:fusaric acid resistance protein FusE [Methylobacterium nodulans]|nr:fusaric acid resistance protein FusE [Methylobacterium nodulans]